MRRGKTRLWVVDVLEGRALMSGATGASPHGPPNLAVQADLAKIQQDQKAVQTDFKAVKQDQASVRLAVQTALTSSPDVQAAKAALAADQKTWQATITADVAAITSAADGTAKQAALTQLKTDITSAAQAFKADRQAIDTAVNADAGVQAARTKLQTDSATLAADLATLKGDQAQLHADLLATASLHRPTSPPRHGH